MNALDVLLALQPVAYEVVTTARYFPRYVFGRLRAWWALGDQHR